MGESLVIKKLQSLGILSYYYSLVGIRYLHCLGDSHAEIFDYIKKNKKLKKTIVRSCIVYGATAMGMVNPKSKTQCLNIFSEYLREKRKSDTFLFMLGEVDCGYLIWYRSKKRIEDLQAQFEKSLTNYKRFLEAQIDSGISNIIVCSVMPPTIGNEENWGDVADLRKEVDVSIEDRTILTIRYNSRLKKICEDLDIIFMDVTSGLLDKSTGLVKEYYKKEDPTDHHLSNDKLTPFILYELNGYGFN